MTSQERKTYTILNYGCQMNESDAEEYAGILEEAGYVVSDQPLSLTDVVIINTCCVRESAEMKIWSKIG